MAWSHVLECECGHRWRVLTLSRQDAYDTTCPNPQCVAHSEPQQALAAPAVARGAAPSTVERVPENKTKAIDYAMRVIAEDNHVTNMKSSLKEGEAAAIAVPEPKGMGWSSAGGMSFDQAHAAVGGDPLNRSNAGMIDAMAKQPGKYLGAGKQAQLAPVYRKPGRA